MLKKSLLLLLVVIIAVFGEKDIYAKDTNFYWYLEVKNIDSFNVEDENKYTLVLTNSIKSISNYQDLKNYILYKGLPYEQPLPLAGETNGIIDNAGKSLWCEIASYNKINNFRVDGDINVTSTARWFKTLRIREPLVLDLKGIHGVTDTSQMFEECSYLPSITIKNFDTSNVTNMNSMFRGCRNSETITLDSKFKTSKVENFGQMFEFCMSLKTIDLSNFDTSKATSLVSMFSECNELEIIDISNFDTSNVTNMSNLFSGCNKVKELDVSNFYTSKVVSMNSMFSGCNSITSLNLSDFNTSNVTNMNDMFSFCTSIQDLDVTMFDTSKVDSMNGMFRGASVKQLDLTNFSSESLIDCGYLFSDMYNIETIYVSDSFDLSLIGDGSYDTFGSAYDPIVCFPYKLVGGQGSYIAHCDESKLPDVVPLDEYDEHNMHYKYKGQSVKSIFGRIDDYDNGKPGYFTEGYHIVYVDDDGTTHRAVGKAGGRIQLETLPNTDTHTFVGWTDGSNVYSDYYLLDDDNVELTPVWTDNKVIESKIDDIYYNGETQYPLPNGMEGLENGEYKAGYIKIDGEQTGASGMTCGRYKAEIALSYDAIQRGYYFLDSDNNRKYDCAIEFNVVPRPLTIDIDSKIMFFGDELPSFTYTQEGLVDNQRIEINMTSDYDYMAPGVYQITGNNVKVFDSNNNDVTNNYNVVVNKGDLEVNEKDKFKVSFKLDDSTCGELYNELSEDSAASFDFTIEADDESFIVCNNNETNTLSLYSTGIEVAAITPKAPQGYTFYGWEINGDVEKISNYRFIRNRYSNITIYAHFVKDTKFYWGLDIDNISEFNRQDRSVKYVLSICQNKEDIDNYNDLLNYKLDNGNPYPLAGESNGIFNYYSDWNHIMSKVSNVSTIGDIDVETTSNWFKELYGVEVLNVDLAGLHHVKYASSMFEGNEDGLKEINISNFDTSKVIDMSHMFEECVNLESISFDEKFITSNVKSFGYMFSYCREIEYVDVTSFDTSKCLGFQYMFSGCINLLQVDVSGFNTSNAVDMRYMFNDCKQLSKLDVSYFNTENVTNMISMFSSCEKLEELNVSNFSTSKVRSYQEMFSGCITLKQLDLSSFKTDSVYGEDYFYLMFYMMPSLEKIYANENFDLSGFTPSLCFGGFVGDRGSLICANLKGSQGTYIAPFDETGYYAKDVDDPYSMYHLYKLDALKTTFARIDEYNNGKPGYFTRGYHIIYNAEDGRKCQAVGEEGNIIELISLSDKPGYTFIGWSDGKKTYTDSYTLKSKDVNLTPVWRKDIAVEQTIDDLTYNGKNQTPLPKTLSKLTNKYYTASYRPVNSEIGECINCGSYIADIVLTSKAIEKGYIFINGDGSKTDSASISFNIIKSPLTITISNKTMYVNGKIPSFTIKTKGLASKHNVHINLISDVDPLVKGKYSITYDGEVTILDKNNNDVSFNYDVVEIKNGIITVGNKPPVPYNPIIEDIGYSIPKTGIQY